MGFAIVLIALIIFIWLVARLVTRVTEDSDPAETDRQMLTAINELHRKGDLSLEEFRSIKGQLIGRLREDRASAADGLSNENGCADLAGSVEHSAAQPALETEETQVDSATRTDLTTPSDSDDVANQEGSQDSGST